MNWNLTISPNKLNHVILAVTFEDYFQHKGGRNSFTSGDNLNQMAGLGFVNPTGGNYRLAPGAPYKGAATDGKDVGVDIDALDAASGASY